MSNNFDNQIFQIILFYHRDRIREVLQYCQQLQIKINDLLNYLLDRSSIIYYIICYIIYCIICYIICYIIMRVIIFNIIYLIMYLIIYLIRYFIICIIICFIIYLTRYLIIRIKSIIMIIKMSKRSARKINISVIKLFISSSSSFSSFS